jgi:glycosyltransferase involved in cell wall biosynthesis
MTNPTISIAMIVKNEQGILARCLRSVVGADEIVIVDTGSKDRTKEIAKEFTNKIYDFEWCDDFAAARNFAKSKCTGDWILSIDADEYLEEDGIQKIREAILVQQFSSATISDALGIRMQSGGQRYHVPRLFKNKPEIFWVGKIHELVNVRASVNLEIGITFDSSPSHAFDPDRNMRILKSAVEEDPTNTRNLYYLGREYGYRHDWENAIKYLEQYSTLATWLPEKADAFFMLALAYWYTQRGEVARECVLKALSINANFKAAILLMGHMSFEHNKVQWDRMAKTATNEGTLFQRDNFLVF